MVSKGAWRASARAGDYCEPDRAQREHRFESCCDHAQTIRNGWSVFYIDGARSRVIARWAIARRKRGEQRSAGSVSAPHDYCEPDRAQRDHRLVSCCDHAIPVRMAGIVHMLSTSFTSIARRKRGGLPQRSGIPDRRPLTSRSKWPGFPFFRISLTTRRHSGIIRADIAA